MLIHTNHYYFIILLVRSMGRFLVTGMYVVTRVTDIYYDVGVFWMATWGLYRYISLQIYLSLRISFFATPILRFKNKHDLYTIKGNIVSIWCLDDSSFSTVAYLGNQNFSRDVESHIKHVTCFYAVKNFRISCLTELYDVHVLLSIIHCIVFKKTNKTVYSLMTHVDARGGHISYKLWAHTMNILFIHKWFIE